MHLRWALSPRHLKLMEHKLGINVGNFNRHWELRTPIFRRPQLNHSAAIGIILVLLGSKDVRIYV
jgi:hypothetical protein